MEVPFAWGPCHVYLIAIQCVTTSFPKRNLRKKTTINSEMKCYPSVIEAISFPLFNHLVH